jgi:hypothetical protein
MRDYNAPWSLTADWRHPVMKKHMEEYDVDVVRMWSEYFYTTQGVHDLANLKEFFTSSYNVFVESYPTYQEASLCVSDAGTFKTKVSNRYRERVNLTRPDIIYDDKYWLELYYYVRLMELQVKKSNLRFNKEIKKIMQIYKHFGLDFAVNYVNIILKETNSQML